jgi:predicted kinase
MPTSSKPLLVIFTGLPGTGKTSISQHVARKLGLPVVAKDAIKEIMYDQIGIGDKAWSGKLARATFGIMELMIDQQLRAGHSVILESNYMPRLASTYFQELQKQYGFRSVQVICRTEATVLANRVHDRSLKDRHPGHNDRATVEEHLHGILQRVENGEDQPLDIPGSEVIVVDTTDFSIVNIDEIIAKISVRN